MDYGIKNLSEVEDSAVKHGFSENQEARFPAQDLGAKTIGFAYYIVRPDKHQPFAHRHEEAEEVYVVLSGSGRIRLDDEVVEIRPLDAIRVAPKIARGFEADSEGLELLAFGPRHEGDGELLKDFWEN